MLNQDWRIFRFPAQSCFQVIRCQVSHLAPDDLRKPHRLENHEQIIETHIPVRFDKRQRGRKQLQGFKYV